MPGDEVWSEQPQKTFTSDTKIRKSFQCYFYQSTKTERNNGKLTLKTYNISDFFNVYFNEVQYTLFTWLNATMLIILSGKIARIENA